MPAGITTTLTNYDGGGGTDGGGHWAEWPGDVHDVEYVRRR